GTLTNMHHQFTAFALFFAVLWGVVLKYFVVRSREAWGILVASLFFTGMVGIPVLLWVYGHLLPESYLQMAGSERGLVSLLGFIFQVGLWEELCKSIPAFAYLAWKRRDARPMTAMMVGIFSG